MDSEQETQAPAAIEGEQPSNESENSAENALDYSDLTVNDLKDKLKELGLPLSGKKSDLVLDMCKKLKAKKYIFGSQGKNYANK